MLTQTPPSTAVPRSGIPGSYNSYIFKLFQTLCTDFFTVAELICIPAYSTPPPPRAPSPVQYFLQDSHADNDEMGQFWFPFPSLCLLQWLRHFAFPGGIRRLSSSMLLPTIWSDYHDRYRVLVHCALWFGFSWWLITIWESFQTGWPFAGFCRNVYLFMSLVYF